MRAANGGGTATTARRARTVPPPARTRTPASSHSTSDTGLPRTTRSPSSPASAIAIAWVPPTTRSCWAPPATASVITRKNDLPAAV
ncbi:Uncharacterised protein [Mycobacteroides abscessus subsp. abscessus]|nr:Uncharacterised protein [Mycobacteroides abscessus subsp. abscessus]